MPRLSVVIPAFRNARFLPAAIDSILSQDYSDFELVIADHSSEDGSDKILAEYEADPRVRVLTPTPPGGGAVANWNRVSAESRGEFIKLVCGDDLVAPGSFVRQVSALDAHPTVVLVAGQRNLIDSGDRLLLGAYGLGGVQGVVGGRDMIKACVRAGTNLLGEPGGVMMRRKALERAGWWDSTFPYLIDQATYAKVLLQGDALAIRSVDASFRISADQWSVRLSRSQSDQAIAFHDSLYRMVPGLLTLRDLRRGNWKAVWMARARRAAYYWLRHRM